jgi:hypothetical protein
MKVGDIMIAVQVCYMRSTRSNALTIGKEYEILKIDDDEYMIIDDNEEEHWYDVEIDEYLTFGRYK